MPNFGNLLTGCSEKLALRFHGEEHGKYLTTNMYVIEKSVSMISLNIILVMGHPIITLYAKG